MPAAGMDPPPLEVLLRRAAAESRRRGRHDVAAAAEMAAADDGARAAFVLGPPGSGKSTVLDALLGVRVCTAGDESGTAAPLLLHWSTASSARVLLPASASGADHADTSLPVEDVALAVSGGGTTSPPAAAAVGLPRDLLKRGLVLVDTPGLADGLTAPWTGRLLALSTWADTVLYVADSRHELDDHDISVLRRLADLGLPLIVALTKVDHYRDWRRVLGRNHLRLQAESITAPLIPLSAPMRRHGLRSGDPVVLEQSGYPRLARALADGLLARVRTDREARMTGAVRTALAHLQGRGRTSPPTEPAGGAQSKSALPRSARASEEFQADLHHRLAGIERDAVTRLHEADVDLVWDSVERSMYGAVAEELSSAALQLHQVGARLLAAARSPAEPLLPTPQTIRASSLLTASAWRSSTGTFAGGLHLLALPEPMHPPPAALRALAARRAGRRVRRSELSGARGEALGELRRYLDECQRLSSAHAAEWLRHVADAAASIGEQGDRQESTTGGAPTLARLAESLASLEAQVESARP